MNDADSECNPLQVLGAIKILSTKITLLFLNLNGLKKILSSQLH